MSDETKPRRSAPVDAGDVLAAAGAGAITYGVWLMHQPAAFIVGGAFLLAVSVIRAIVKART